MLAMYLKYSEHMFDSTQAPVIGLDGHTKDGSILDINLIFGKLFFSKSPTMSQNVIYFFNENDSFVFH